MDRWLTLNGNEVSPSGLGSLWCAISVSFVATLFNPQPTARKQSRYAMTLVVHRLGIIAPPLAQNKAPDGGLGLLVRFLAVGCGLNKTPDGWLGCLVRFLAVGAC